MKKIFTSESVTSGHPDKLCDLISDSVLDAYLSLDKNARVACETVATKGKILVTGEITSKANVDIEKIVRNTIKDIGYFGKEFDIDYSTCEVEVLISKQSEDIAMGVDIDGAGDQGIMFGFACKETEELMPLPIMLAHKLAKRLEYVRKENLIHGLGPDGKVQVSVEYDDDIIKRVDTVVVSTEHREDIDINYLKSEIMEKVIKYVIDGSLLDKDTKYLINPTGKFTIGGPLGDVGLTGRKIIVDTYGGYSRHGGGAFSGKDATKVDRSACYMARHIAKNVVANNLASKCEIELSYAIGVKEPVSIYVDTFGTNVIPENDIVNIIKEKFDLTPKGIIKYLKLDQPIYTKTTNYGHFGKQELEWEKVIKL